MSNFMGSFGDLWQIGRGEDLDQANAEIDRLRAAVDLANWALADLGVANQVYMDTTTEQAATIARLSGENEALTAWARRAWVMLDCIETDGGGGWNMFNLLEDAPPQVRKD